jgi:hypothetical protein
MKKINLFLVIGFALLLGSCKKDHSLNSNPSEGISSSIKESQTQNNNYMGRVHSDGLSLNSYGFLKFNTTNDYVKFLESIRTSTNGEIKKVLLDLGFVSNANVSSSLDLAKIAESQYEEYLINSTGFIEIGNVILRKKSNGEFVLTCNSSNFTSTVYNNMLSDIYVSSKMNQFAINGSRTKEFDIIQYCQNSPNGLLENPKPNNYLGERKFFGWGTYTYNVPAPEYGPYACWEWECDRYYAFGIVVTTTNCAQSVLVNCNGTP